VPQREIVLTHIYGDHVASAAQLVQHTAGGGTILSVPGHTPGRIALRAPDRGGVLFTGDTLAPDPGAPILGPFNQASPGGAANA
jgi:hypothetical protein